MGIGGGEEGFKGIIVGEENGWEGGVVNNVEVYGVEGIREVMDFVKGNWSLEGRIVKRGEELYKEE